MTEQNHTPSDGASLVTFNFHGDELDVVTRGGEVYVSIRRVCEALGVDVTRQLQKLRDDPSATVDMMPMVAEDGKNREIACINLRSLPLWLATIHPNKVKPDIREKLVLYRREAAEVLADHFLGRRGAGGIDASAFGAAIAPLAKAIETMALAFAEQNKRIEALEQRGAGHGGIVGPAVGKHIRLELLRLAGILHRCGRAKSKASALTRLSNQLRGAVGWAGTGCSWDRLPIAQHAAGLRELDVMRRTAEGIADALNAGRQVVLPLRAVRQGDPV